MSLTISRPLSFWLSLAFRFDDLISSNGPFNNLKNPTPKELTSISEQRLEEALLKVPKDGYVLRARISAFGYGKAIYLKLIDGNTVVYAHLSKFWPDLENFLDQQRLENKEYRIDRQFTSQQFPVKRGQIIGYSGKSGIGYPHLHFEIRDPQNRPVNPLQYYQTVFKDQLHRRSISWLLFQWITVS